MPSRQPPWIRIRNRRRLLAASAALCGVLLIAFAAVNGHSYAARTYALGQSQQSIPDSLASSSPFQAVTGPAADMPNSLLTPGAVATSDRMIVCRPGYATSVRPTGPLWRRLKEQAYAEYGIPRGHRSYVDEHGVRHPAYEVDHLIPLEIGGAPTDIRNLWPEPTHSARVKDEVENQLHDLVCNGRMSITQAQAAIAHDWETAIPDETAQ